MSPNRKKVLEDTLVDLLAVVYSKINWHSMKTSKNPHDIFNHRVRSASRRGTIYAFASKLCNYFGLQTLPGESIGLVEDLRKDEVYVLTRLYSEHIPFCVRAIIKGKEIKSSRKSKPTFDIDIQDMYEQKKTEEVKE